MTGTALINQALQLIGILAPGRSAATDEYSTCLSVLNQLISNWTSEETPIYSVARNSHTLTGAQSYTIGTGASINTTRPVRILSGAVLIGSTTGPSSPLEIVDAVRWQAIQDKTRSGKFARVLYCDYAFPTATIYLWPVPATSGILHLESLKPLGGWANLAADVSLPDGYERALIFGLAVSLAPNFAGSKLEQSVIAMAESAKAAITGLNERTLFSPPASSGAVAAAAEGGAK